MLSVTTKKQQHAVVSEYQTVIIIIVGYIRGSKFSWLSSKGLVCGLNFCVVYDNAQKINCGIKIRGFKKPRKYPTIQ